MTIDQGRTESLWLKKEASYGAEEALVAANAMRYISLSQTHQPNNRVDSPEKNPSPGRFRRFNRKPATSLDSLVFNIQPSGTLNTLSENDPIFECVFGAKTNVTLDTTVSASPSPTTTGCTVASAGALVAGDAVLIEVTGQAGPYVRVLATVVSNALTWTEALPAAPTTGDFVRGCVTYKLTTALALSLTTLRAKTSGKKDALIGLGMDTLALAFDANAEVQATVGGPAKTLLSTSASQAAPGSSSFVGTQNPPSGILDGYTMIAGVVYPMKSIGISFTNALQLRNQEYGVSLSTEQNRNGRRPIDITMDAFVETEATLKDKAEAGTHVSVLNQTGKTEGNIIAVYMPNVDFAYPSEDDPEGEKTWSFAGAALESAQGANDEFKLILA